MKAGDRKNSRSSNGCEDRPVDEESESRHVRSPPLTFDWATAVAARRRR